MQEKRWYIPPPLPPETDKALQGYPPVLRQILYNRGYASAEAARRFLEALPPADTSPFQLTDLEKAAARVQHAIERGEPIVVYGDYDVDGISATALLLDFLQAAGGRATPYIPHRFDEGYGLNQDAIRHLSEQGAALIIAVDCGIRSLAEADLARQLGTDLIICDHHHPGETLPQALAVIDPKRAGDAYPEKNLAGVGVAYKLACGIAQKMGLPDELLSPLLDLVALGTVADLVPLSGENRSLVRQGLARLRRPQRQGLLSLMGVAGIKPQRLTATDIGFALGPRLNAAGRLDTAMDALALLIASDVYQAARLAQQLDVQNRHRQKLTQTIQEQAEALALEGDPEAFLLFAAHPSFNAGVVGLAASRLVERHYRPAIVGQQDAEYTRASCRSIPEFHITEALDACSDLLEKYGGHAAAAGFTVRNEKLPELVTRLKSLAAEKLAGEDLRPTLTADLEIQLTDLKPEILEYLDWLQPTGYGNPAARFVSRGVRVLSQRAVGSERNHLKLVVSDGYITFDAIAFRQGHWADRLPPQIDLLYRFELNEFRGRKSLQLNVLDIKPSA
ncbi:MAG: single-stranded-DNA-specific exonuclease RecJ [Anaerolineae bacterium]|nr:MAG: single-stranded-DNA-specific exonuclease RecJ [Anaerolineae bacterium]